MAKKGRKQWRKKVHKKKSMKAIAEEVVKHELQKELEVKRYLTGLASTVTPVSLTVGLGPTGPYGQLIHLSNVPATTTPSDPYSREGNKIMPLSLRMKFIFQTANGSTEPYTYVRLIIFRYRQSPDEGGFSGSGGTAPSLGPFVDLNSSTATTTSLDQPILAQKDIDYAKTHVVLYDKIHLITQYLNFYNEGAKCVKLVQLNFKLPKIPCQYSGPAGGTTLANEGPNNYFAIIVPNKSAKVTMQYMSELYFRDA